jgi:hypothetical protein
VAARETGLRRIALVTTGIAVAGVAGATLVACTVSGTPPTTSSTSTSQSSTSDTQSGSGGVSSGNGSAHAHSGGS